jgi:5-methylcytosine-specific restriction protein A
LADAKREFRTRESLEAEKRTRDMVPALLTQRGFSHADTRRQHGPAQSQVIDAVSPGGVPMRMHVRLCWRRDGRTQQEQKYSATQLRADLIDDDWDLTLASIAEREEANGNSHNLLVQADQTAIRWAALVPSDQIPAIFQRQFEVSRQLIDDGLTGGRRKKNHARNGNSPTLWLQDDSTPETHAVADVIWSWPGMIDVVALPPTAGLLTNDAYDDLPIDMLGRDAGTRVVRQTSGYSRDPKVRALVLARARGVCEREGCGESRTFPEFLDVHHILGVRESDRVSSCVALCPNCHREAHFAPDRDAVNAALQAYASRFGS